MDAGFCGYGGFDVAYARLARHAVDVDADRRQFVVIGGDRERLQRLVEVAHRVQGGHAGETAALRFLLHVQRITRFPKYTLFEVRFGFNAQKKL